ncbi:TadE/TadG family type IV pilus assembly protein [Novosphingobium sp. 17-62-19]|uniref:TadE/TadG family type IV pilus assembly protein n=1 Tax=Novosphingobium sp. 17-62-19 TaxID=1970406 RepID=UPI0025D8C855|nr:TadE/TadG family type IV pilus assembly protein [Novosphingobium sp. 17-62-19]HQS95665.1 Tad domain-containing protein [Novosphingobium sp.]
MSGFLSRLRTSTAGSVLPIAAVSVPVIIALIGGGLDINRVYKARNRLQSACDAATLAGRRAVTTGGYGNPEKAQAATYFNTNFVQGDLGAEDTTFVTSSPDNGNMIHGTATTKVQTAVMNMLGYEEIDVSVSCKATMGVGNSDITMVLDNTGSMAWELGDTGETRLQALRTAMKNFYTTVSTATTGSNARIRYSFVPYSSSVNVGNLIYDLDPRYIVDSWAIQSREPVYNNISEQVFVGWSEPVYTSEQNYSEENNGQTTKHSNTKYSKKRNCENNMPDDGSWQNYGDVTYTPDEYTNEDGQRVVSNRTNQPQKRTRYVCEKSSGDWYVMSYQSTRVFYTYQYATSEPVYETRTRQEFSRWAYKNVNYDTSIYKTFVSSSVNNGENASLVNYTWGGCIEERETDSASSFSYSNLLGMTPSDAKDLDIDSLPDVDDESTKWAPMWPELAYYRVNSRGDLTSSAETTRGGKAGSYCPQKAKLLNTMSQSEFNTYTDSLSATGSTYHDIGMIWGLRLSSPTGPWQNTVNIQPSNGGKVSRHIIFMTDGEMAPSISIQSAYGIEWHDRRVTDDGNSSHSTRHTARFRALCDAAKAKGFRVWVIAFASSLTEDLTYCASSNSSYLATNATQLNTAFQEIAKNVGELRIYQ